MSWIRQNAVKNPDALAKYIKAVNLLKREPSGKSTADFGIPGPNNPVSSYDVFVIWHIQVSNAAIPVGGDPMVRNWAHRGPVFLPWHRMMLLYLEGQCQRLLGSKDKPDRTFGLPYWDWSADGDNGSSPNAPIWQPTRMGGQGLPVSDGPFAYRPGDPNSFTVRIESTWDGKPSQANGGQGRGLMRQFGSGWEVLPTGTDVKNALAFGPPGPTRSRGTGTTSPTTASARTASAAASRAGPPTRTPARRAPGCTIRSTRGSAGTCPPRAPPTIRCSFCTTATWTASGRAG